MLSAPPASGSAHVSVVAVKDWTVHDEPSVRLSSCTPWADEVKDAPPLVSTVVLSEPVWLPNRLGTGLKFANRPSKSADGVIVGAPVPTGFHAMSTSADA